MSQIYFHTPSEHSGRSWAALAGALGLLLMSVLTILAGEAVYDWEGRSGMQAALEPCRFEPTQSGDCRREEPGRSGPRL
jgi:hypothetical protein